MPPAHGLPVAVLTRKTASAYAVLRAVRLLQARGTLPGHAGLEVGGVHVHHNVWGFALVLGQRVMRRGACLHRPLRANVLCTGAALVLDEVDLLVRAEEGGPLSRRLRLVLDVAGAVGALDGLRHWRSTWSGWYRERPA